MNKMTIRTVEKLFFTKVFFLSLVDLNFRTFGHNFMLWIFFHAFVVWSIVKVLLKSFFVRMDGFKLMSWQLRIRNK